MSEFGPERPQDCRLLVVITFHYSAPRLPTLLEVVRTLAEFPVQALDCVILTNHDATDLDRRRAILRRLLAPLFSASHTLDIQVAAPLEDPLDLPWQAKPLIRDRFLDGDANHTHLIHIEDDMRFGWRNFAYWHRSRPLLAEARLIPSFLRIEYSAQAEELRCVELKTPIDITRRAHIRHEGTVFLSAPNPYAALYVLDQALAAEHVASRSFDRDRSLALKPEWKTRERAAAGLCWESPPPGFHCRHAIPIDTATLSVPPEAWVFHLGNRFADGETRFGKLPVQRMVHR